jgi:GR25 family glycosyltransferase involved in LPS biosynthesis
MFKIIYINLGRSINRKTQIENQLAYHFPNYPIQREAAVDGSKFTLEDVKDILDPRAYYYLRSHNRRRLLNEDINNFGQIACSLSHFNCWKKLIEDDNHEYYLICEDDVVFYPDIQQKTEKILKDNPNLDFYSLVYVNSRGNKKVNNHLKITKPFYGTQTYLISKKAAKLFLENSFPIVSQVDAFIGYISFKYNLNSYMLSFPAGKENGYTEIGHEREHCVLCNIPYENEVEIGGYKNVTNKEINTKKSYILYLLLGLFIGVFICLIINLCFRIKG